MNWIIIFGPIGIGVILVIVLYLAIRKDGVMVIIELMKNQIAMVLGIYLVIAIGAFLALDGATIKEIITLLVTSAGSLVTGQAMERKRSTDIKPPEAQGGG